jgi:predicted permease
MQDLIRDCRYAVRQLRKNPGFTLIAVFTLALGIGANTGIFTLVNAVLMKSLPVPSPEQLFLVRMSDRADENTRFSYPLFENMRAALPPSAIMAAMTWPAEFYTSFGHERPEMATGQLVSGNYFQALETHPAIGRLFTSEDDRVTTGSPIAVISYGCWQRRFGRDPKVIGRKIVINGMPLELVGVAAPGFFGTRAGTAPEFWLPVVMQSALHYAQHYSQTEAAEFDKPWVFQAAIRWLQFIVRVRNPETFSQASAVLNQVFGQELAREGLDASDPLSRVRIVLEPGSKGLATLRRSFSRPLLVLMGVVGLVLLIACANLASLQLARAATREREIAVRLSLGATPARLLRQLLTEGVLLSVFGGVVGLAVAYWCCAVLPKWASGRATPIPLNLTPDARVLLFSLSIALLSGILSGLVPAWQGTRVEPVKALKKRAAGTSGEGEIWSFQQTLVAGQIALSLVLLVGSGLFLRTLQNFSALDPGFDRDHILTVWLDTHMASYKEAQLASLYQRLIAEVEAVPGVRSASLASCGLATGCGDSSDIYLPGVPHANGETDAQERRVSQHFFQTAGMPVLAGRDFASTDKETTPAVTIVNEAFVRQFLGKGDPIGQYFGYDATHDHRFQIVGVVKDARVNDIREDAPPMIYHSVVQDLTDVESLDVRTSADPRRLMAQVRQAVSRVDPNLPVGGITTLSEQVKSNLAQQRLIARLSTLSGALALGLVCLGLYGMMSYTVARRTSELGVRLALGSTRANILWVVLERSLIVTGCGILLGTCLSLAGTRVVSRMLFGLSPHDPLTLGMAAILLFLVATASGLPPAWRAAHVNPTDALRGD